MNIFEIRFLYGMAYTMSLMLRRDFSQEERERREFIKRIRDLSPYEFREEDWERLREMIYPPEPLDVDVIIDDTTLREGVQMSGLITPSPEDMCKIACMLYELGVERIEVKSFTSNDVEGIRLMHEMGLSDVLANWCRGSKEDIDRSLKLDFSQIGLSHPVSYIHFEKWPDKTCEELVNRVVSLVEYAVDHGLTVFVHGEDSTRADWGFEREFINAVAEAGAKVYRICDTVGIARSWPEAPLPIGIPAKIKKIKEETKIPYLEIHAHNDLGNAVANTMAAIRAASGLYDKFYVSTTFLGLGDRTGNAETEVIMMNCYIHHGIKKHWKLHLLRQTANFIASALNYHMPINKSIVGDSAFEHKSGIHQHGIKALPLTYEAYPPELVGQERRIAIGPGSGRHGIVMEIKRMTGLELDEDDPRVVKIVEMVKHEFDTRERYHNIKDYELARMISSVGLPLAEKYKKLLKQ